MLNDNYFFTSHPLVEREYSHGDTRFVEDTTATCRAPQWRLDGMSRCAAPADWEVALIDDPRQRTPKITAWRPYCAVHAQRFLAYRQFEDCDAGVRKSVREWRRDEVARASARDAKRDWYKALNL